MDCTSQLLYSRLGWIGSRSYHVTKSRRILHEPKKRGYTVKDIDASMELVKFSRGKNRNWGEVGKFCLR